ncbi:MAG: hypothetical protein VR64_23400 [Desulfatitalea sp. BRH_c12]|nr:MAG: hypothetical protein VR64_23400 [Desulfatitalea sp. BRH_c12]
MCKKKLFSLPPVWSTLILLLLLGCGGSGGGGSDPVPVTTPKTLSVGINYVDTFLPSCDAIDAYFNVLDPDGISIGVPQNNVKVFLNTDPNPLELVDFQWPADINMPNSIAIVMDYSGTIVDNPLLQQKMEIAVKAFVQLMEEDDAGEIIKFATEYERMNFFTSDKTVLEEAVTTLPTAIGRETNIYDTLWFAVDEAAAEAALQPCRSAVIILTDGEQLLNKTKDEILIHGLDDTIQHAIESQVPVYTIGLGTKDKTNIIRIASETNGLYFEATNGDELSAIYSEISTVLAQQHRVRVSGIPAGTHNLKIVVTYGKLTAENSRAFTLSCP